MAQVWTEDNSIGNTLAGLYDNFSGANAATKANTIEDILQKRRLAQTQADLVKNYDIYQKTQKPTDLTTPLPPELGGSIELNVPTAQWTDPQGTYQAERNLGQSQYALAALKASSAGDVATNMPKIQAQERLNTTGLPTSATGLTTMQTQLTGSIPETALKNNPLQDEANMRIEMARQQAAVAAGQTLSPTDIITGQQIAAKLIGAEKKEAPGPDMRPTIYTVPNAPPPGYEKWAAAVGWGAGGSSAKDPTVTTSPQSVGAGPSGPVVAGPAPAGPSAFSQGAPPVTQTPPPGVATAAPASAALPPAVTGPAGIPIATPPAAQAANAPPIVPPASAGGIASTSYGNANPKDLRTEYEARPAVKQYLIAYDASQAAYAALKNGGAEADKVALAKFAQAVEANTTAGANQLAPGRAGGESLAGLIKGAWQTLAGGGELDEKTRRSILNETIKQTNVAYERAAQETERFRVMARNGGLPNPDVVAPQLPPPPKYEPGRIAKPGTHNAPGPAKTRAAAPQSNLNDVDAIVFGR